MAIYLDPATTTQIINGLFALMTAVLVAWINKK